MSTKPFLTINDQSLTCSQAIKYLQSSGRLRNFIEEILRQYIIEQELQQRKVDDVDPAIVEQALINFRLENQLSDPDKFQAWLASNGMDFATFYNQVANSFRLDQLKTQITETKIQEYFIERKLFLDQVVLSRIVVDNQERAEELRSQIEEGASFEKLAKEYSLIDDRIFNGMMGPVSRGTLPDQLRAAVDTASPGDLIGPFQQEKRFGLFRVEHFLPASLEDNKLKEALANELFEQWLAEKMQKMKINLQLD